ncbi:GntR family transcriptional regulator [Aquicoccus porphyridii]|uniref:GntR family transcriptional regulator n=1 Tax=Aquicoccus porphyridii TaxID=1852029 RepID=UPI00273E635E|nr:GntR family transcriptional regulator [Aquicoccus porphyridii]
MLGSNPGFQREGGSVCEILREDILSLAIAPGSTLEEKVLAEKYQVSRTPIREAFIRLAAEGLVEFRPRRGVQVIPIILPNLPRYLETSSLIQRSLVRLAAFRRHKRDLSRIANAIAELRAHTVQIDIHDYDSVIRAAASENAALHAIAEGAHNVYLLEIYEKLRLQGQRMLRLAFCYCPKGEVDVAEFAGLRVQRMEDLVDLIRDGDADGAEAQSKQLHSDMVERLMAYLAEDLTEGVEIEASELGGQAPE